MGVSPSSGGARLRAATIHKELSPILLALSTAFMIWKASVSITSATVPVVVVVSESMVPAFHRGDLLFLWNRQQAINVGDIPVVWFPGNKSPMVHRAVQVHWTEDATVEASQWISTKGDNNEIDDRPSYPVGRDYVERDEIVGVVRGYIPYLGWAAIAMGEYPWVKALVAIFVTAASIS